MNLASKVAQWASEGKVGTHVDVELTASTGRTLRFYTRFHAEHGGAVDWGDGSPVQEIPYVPGEGNYISHTFASYGNYTIVFKDLRGIGFRYLDGQAQGNYDDSVLSVVDYSGRLEDAPSACFKYATRLKRFIAPNLRWMGQRSFAYCSNLEEVRLGKVYIHYDGSFQYCPKLVKFATESTGTCWSYVWMGCTALRELRLGSVKQFATQDFYSCPNLMDIYISDKTIAQVKQIASEGNIVAGYGARFPWYANDACRFHCSDGIVLANGTIIEQH